MNYIIHFLKIKIYFGLKDKLKNYFTHIILIFLIQCNQFSYHQMAINNPSELIAQENSLSIQGLDSKKKEALVIAHKNIGLSDIENNNYLKAKTHFSRVLFYSKDDSIAQYNLYMIEGHLLRKKGKKDKLWDAIQMYYKAASLKPMEGEPYFFIGQSYKILGNRDFDLILESYQKALDLHLSPKIKAKVEHEFLLVSDREKRLNDFWK
tara:strand:- start:1474 stop:2097 length:624 start_codon:yes stop_codon:yes gene_type:complete